jgi:hypothetical protein
MELPKKVPRYIIDLDDSPKDRWSGILKDYKDEMIKMKEFIDKLLKELQLEGYFASFALKMLEIAAKVGWVYESEELIALSEMSGIELGKLIAMQLLYEASATCTSIIIQGKEFPIHIRTMDWELDLLKSLTIEIDFRKNNKHLFLATSWVGYIGILTAMKTGKFSVSIKYRNTEDGTMLHNLFQLLFYSWPTSFLLRETMTIASTYEVVSILTNSSLIAPCYFTICGTKKGEGVVLSRDRKSSQNPNTIEKYGFVVQTNMDHWEKEKNSNILDSGERRKLAMNCLEQVTCPTYNYLWSLMGTKPINNEETIYTTIMSAGNGTYETRVETPKTI